jgi:hypothetical protein
VIDRDAILIPQGNDIVNDIGNDIDENKYIEI